MSAGQLLTIRNGIFLAIAVVLALLGWSYWKGRRRVLDPSDDAYARGLFDAMNPDVPGVRTGGVPS